MTLTTRFTEAYGIRHPIACAAMAFVASDPGLAIAVAKAGGLGAIGAGAMPPEAIGMVVGAFRANAAGPIHINLVVFLTNDAMIDACVAVRPDIVSFHWGHPTRAWIERLQGAGIKVWEQIGSVAAAVAAITDGVDLVIVQGSEAGGHNCGELPIFTAIPAVRKAVGVTPLLLAAGGIGDGATMAAALALRADGVVVGSRFVASVEGDAHADYKQAIVESDGSDTCLTSMFGRDMPHFNPMRVIANRVVREWQGREDEMPAEDNRLPQIGTTHVGGQDIPLARFSGFVPTRGATGDLQEMAFLAGQGIGQITSIETVATIIETMVTDAEAVIAALAKQSA